MPDYSGFKLRIIYENLTRGNGEGRAKSHRSLGRGGGHAQMLKSINAEIPGPNFTTDEEIEKTRRHRRTKESHENVRRSLGLGGFYYIGSAEGHEYSALMLRTNLYFNCIKDIVLKAYKFRLYPTKSQRTKMVRTLDLCRWTYNQTLAY